ncbi:hypothetical protein DICPUDRAFT_98913 [Dictyostelium purpureum]|uniref:LIM zinc-binding domain-containing protein n=1 Tax=Dictyostelium purpureum TaxID=5786 RepID=F0ZUR9_DICPU|nr:uncharacterized protein DICPUDRAFT_98913 [Dictyostelium purpureum]EGC32314.1 hypothetical protein DICPUDRAFT_98913 [Dictyostelium purpureum]|eukprot:XP_003291156.1 hypothetical protein DICPUDRAFT_98913 [Dictyostelium purpureum]
MIQKFLQRSSSYIKVFVKTDKRKKLERKYKSHPNLKTCSGFSEFKNTNSNIYTKMVEYKSGTLYKVSTGIFKNRKKYCYQIQSKIYSYQISKNIELLQKEKDSLATTYGFILEYSDSSSSSTSTNKLNIHSDSLSILADWIVKIDGMTHPNFKSFLNQVDRKQLLKILYKDNIKGGIIKSSDTEEEWNYSSMGTLQIEPTTSVNEEKIDYHWDGEWIKSSTHNHILGYGRFNGVYLAWFIKDPTFPEIRYFYDEKEKEYISDKKEFTFKWTRHFLASKYGSGEWIVEGHVPQPVVMFLQLIKYKRNSSKPGYVTPFACEIPPPSSSPSIPRSEQSSSLPTLPIISPASPVLPNDSQYSTSSPAIDNIKLFLSEPINRKSLSISDNSFISKPNDIGNSIKPTTEDKPKDNIDIKNNTDTNSNNDEDAEKSKLNIPEGSKASTIKISPFTRGSALLNVTHILFNNQDSTEDEQDKLKQQEIFNFSNSSDDLSSSDTNKTHHQHNTSNSDSVYNDTEVINTINNIKNNNDNNNNGDNNSSGSAQGDIKFNNDILEKNNEEKLEIKIEEKEEKEEKEKEENSTEEKDKIDTNNITNNTDNIVENNSVDKEIIIEQQQNKIKINHQRRSTLQLLDQTIKETERIQNRKPEIDKDFLQRIIGDGGLGKKDSFEMASSASVEEEAKPRELKVVPRSSLNSIANSPSTSNESLSPVSKFTTPLGSIIGPSTKFTINKTSINNNEETKDNNTTSNTNNNNNSNSNDINNNSPINNIKKHSDDKESNNNKDEIKNNPNHSTIGNHRKPLAKSKSSDKVTTIINQITSTRQSRNTFCLGCNLQISGPMVVAQGNHFHQECFKCNKCNELLCADNKTFYRQVDTFVNQTSTSSTNNFVTLSSSPSSSPSKFNPHSHSNTSLLSIALSQSPLSHSPLSNSPSSNLLSNSPSIGNSMSISSIQNNHIKSGPKYLCQSCFDDVCPICPKCNCNVMYRCVNALGRKWHPDHFCCKECAIPLVGSIFYEKNSNPYCQKDYNRLFNNN